jgi:nucleolar protein 56
MVQITDGKPVKITIVESVMGVFAFGEDNRLVEKFFFPKDTIKAAEKLQKIEAGKLIKEIEILVRKLQELGYSNFVFENLEMARNVRERLNVEASTVRDSDSGKNLRGDLEKFAMELKFMKKPEQFRVWMHKISLELAKMKVKKSVEKRDLLVAQAVQTVDDLDKSLNLFMSRMREWYGLHYPELDRMIDKHETYARLVVDLGAKDNFTAGNLENEGLPKSKAQKLAMVASASMGAELNDEDLAQIQAICRNLLRLFDTRQSLEKYIDAIMEEVAPNTRAIAGSLLGARLVALAGGLVNLAKLPASTIQVLGAEKALFRSLKTKARPPKHGIIFQHPLIHDAKRWQRGKIARALAGKLTIAARVDAFSGKYAGEELKADLDKRVEEIKERYEKPPSPHKSEDRKRSWRKKRGRRS